MCLQFTSRTYRLSHNSPVKSPGMPPLRSCQDRLASWVGAGKKLRWPGNSADSQILRQKWTVLPPCFMRGDQNGTYFWEDSKLMQSLFGNFDVFFPVIRALFGLVMFF